MSISGELIVSRHIAESISTDAGCFSHVGQYAVVSVVLYAVDKGRPTRPKRPASVAIDSVTYLLTISMPNIAIL